MTASLISSGALKSRSATEREITPSCQRPHLRAARFRRNERSTESKLDMSPPKRLECRSIEVLEYWWSRKRRFPLIPLLHHSNTPLLQFIHSSLPEGRPRIS